VPLKAIALLHSGVFRSGEARSRADGYRMIQYRAEATGLDTKIGCHSWQARGITSYLENGGLLEHAQQMAVEEVGKIWL
jgi:hypothetical protein